MCNKTRFLCLAALLLVAETYGKEVTPLNTESAELPTNVLQLIPERYNTTANTMNGLQKSNYPHRERNTEPWDQYPYVVLIMKDDTVVSGGVIIAEKYVLTSDELIGLYKPSDLKVIANGIIKVVLNVTGQHGYQSGQIAVIANDGYVHYSDVPTIDTSVCEEAYTYLGIGNEHICTKGGTYDEYYCVPTLGDPLVCDGVLTGIATLLNYCAMENVPGVYGNVALQRNWIEEQMDRQPASTPSTTTPSGAELNYSNSQILSTVLILRTSLWIFSRCTGLRA